MGSENKAILSPQAGPYCWMVQKSQGQPPFGFYKLPCLNHGNFTYLSLNNWWVNPEFLVAINRWSRIWRRLQKAHRWMTWSLKQKMWTTLRISRDPQRPGYFKDRFTLRHTGSFTLPLESPRSLGYTCICFGVGRCLLFFFGKAQTLFFGSIFKGRALS